MFGSCNVIHYYNARQSDDILTLDLSSAYATKGTQRIKEKRPIFSLASYSYHILPLELDISVKAAQVRLLVVPQRISGPAPTTCTHQLPVKDSFRKSLVIYSQDVSQVSSLTGLSKQFQRVQLILNIHERHSFEHWNSSFPFFLNVISLA